ncbi:MAG: hypothetical protein ACK52S_10195 [Pirellula sp.]|jgi:hypothetical protein
MNTPNPYHPLTCSEPTTFTSSIPSNRALWRAYFFAPAVAPLAFVAMVFLVAFASEIFGADVNPASILILPVLALTIGVLSCYFVAGVLGMPIAFYLRRRNSLNGYSIHLAAFCWALLFTTFCALLFVGFKWDGLPMAVCYVGLGVIPPVVLSGTAFWLLVRLFSRWDNAHT